MDASEVIRFIHIVFVICVIVFCLIQMIKIIFFEDE